MVPWNPSSSNSWIYLYFTMTTLSTNLQSLRLAWTVAFDRDGPARPTMVSSSVLMYVLTTASAVVISAVGGLPLVPPTCLVNQI